MDIPRLTVGRPPTVAILDNLAVAQGLAQALVSIAGAHEAQATGCLQDLANSVADRPPDVLLIDIASENVGERLEVCDLPAVKDGRSRVLFLSRHDERSLLEASKRCASGFLLKTTPLQIVAHAIEIIAGGGQVFDSHCNRAPERQRPTQRELELLHLLGTGLTNRAIAHELGISPRTVDSHMRRLFGRYGASSRSQLLMIAVHQGWITASEIALD